MDTLPAWISFSLWPIDRGGPTGGHGYGDRQTCRRDGKARKAAYIKMNRNARGKQTPLPSILLE